MTSYMPALRNAGTIVANLRAARSDVGSGGGSGETYLKIDDRDGEMTFGQEQNPLPPDHKFVVGLHNFLHGYIDMRDGQVQERKVVPMAQQPDRPVPTGGYGTYESGGPRNVTEIVLNSIDEPGFNLTFTAWGVSSANRIRNLLDAAILHSESPEGAGGYIHPVIEVRAGKYYSKKFKRDVYHFDYTVVDWLHTDGSQLLSAHGGQIEQMNGNDGDAPPWEDDLTEQEEELLGAA